MIKINKLEIENVKRVKAVKMEPAATGLTVIGGNNRQGKTSVLDAIAWALGGERFRPSNAQRDESVIPPDLKVTMSNGLIVERKGKNSDLKVTDSTGVKSGQKLLDTFVEQLAINLPRFMESKSTEKAQVLLKIIGLGDQLAALDKQEQEVFQDRLLTGRIADQKEKFAKEQTYYPDAPKELISAGDLIKEQQEILAKNGENQRKRERLAQLQYQSDRLSEQMAELQRQQSAIIADLEIAKTSALDLQDKGTEDLENSINNIEAINIKVRSNMDKEKAEMDAHAYTVKYDNLTAQLTSIRQQKTDLLTGANLPLPGLSIEDGELTYNSKKWDCMSAAEQLKVSTSIVRKLNPECGFVLLDKLEQMDINELQTFGLWLEQEGLQAIATRVSTGSECSIIIEDGYIKETDIPAPEPVKDWKEGAF